MSIGITTYFSRNLSVFHEILKKIDKGKSISKLQYIGKNKIKKIKIPSNLIGDTFERKTFCCGADYVYNETPTMLVSGEQTIINSLELLASSASTISCVWGKFHSSHR
jgi:hypothetical protein